MVSILVSLLVLALLLYCATLIVDRFFKEPIKEFGYITIGVIGIICLLRIFGVWI